MVSRVRSEHVGTDSMHVLNDNQNDVTCKHCFDDKD